MRKDRPQEPETGQVISSDGTRIGYRKLGHGPSLILLHGTTRASQHYLNLAQALADQHTVYLPDRRGRGLSGPYGDDYGMHKELEDLAALLQASGAERVFGHSAGGLIALEAALSLPIPRLAVYEPGVSIQGSIPSAWLPAFEQALKQQDSLTAMEIMLREVPLNWVARLPRFALRLFARAMLSGSNGPETLALLPTAVQDLKEIQKLDSSYARYRLIRSNTLLLGGSKSPDYLTQALPVLAQTIPAAHSRRLPGLDHNAPDLNAPAKIAAELIAFFA